MTTELKTENRILVIDDNEAIHEDFRKILVGTQTNEAYNELDAEIFGTQTNSQITLPEFQVDFASQGREGLERIQQSVTSGNRYSIAFVDVRMPPGWDGVETATEILKVDPKIQIVFCTAYSDYATEDILSHFGLADNIMILQKPFEAHEVELLAVSLTEKWKTNIELARITKTQSNTLVRASKILDEVQNANELLNREKRELQENSLSLEGALQASTLQLSEAEDLALFAMATVVEARDFQTGEHIRRMQSYAQLIAVHLSQHGPYVDLIDDNFLKQFYRSTPLHDIGKVGIPDGILLKPGNLSEPEFQMMKQHPVMGYEIIGRAAAANSYGDFLKMAALIARHHHERWDGAGYPDGLSAENIPLSARIAAVADAFDAISSSRVYSVAKTELQAKEIIVNESGKHFDPNVVTAFLAVFPEICDEKRSIDRDSRSLA